MLEDLVEDPSKVRWVVKRNDSIFSDVAYSSIAEDLSPTELVHLLNDYLFQMCNIILGIQISLINLKATPLLLLGCPWSLIMPDVRILQVRYG